FSLSYVPYYSSIVFSFFFYFYVVHLDLHSFPTRRSSDLDVFSLVVPIQAQFLIVGIEDQVVGHLELALVLLEALLVVFPLTVFRSEEHTSELQSRGHLVCRLLLEKKKTRMALRLLIRTVV